jgi:ElaB/YqjD/DUF883 family membrane-anchored ribosome-binding protein
MENHGRCYREPVAKMAELDACMKKSEKSEGLLGGTKMTTQTTETVNKNGRIMETLETAGKYAVAAMDIEMLKKRIENTVDDVVIDAQRMAKRGRYAMEDAIDDAAYRIKKDPLRITGYFFGAGLGLGVLTGWLLTRRTNNLSQ